MPTTGNGDLPVPPRRQCPCENFTALSKIVDTLDSPTAMQAMIDWLDGRTDDLALEHQQLLSCGKRSRCRFRYGTSFAILNSIRDACRPHLTVDLSSSPTAGEGTFSYEEEFPSLQKSTPPTANTTKQHPAIDNILVPPSKVYSKMKVDDTPTTVQNKTNKRRIRPAQVQEPLDQGSNVWNAQVSVWANRNSSTLSYGKPLSPTIITQPSPGAPTPTGIATMPSQESTTQVLKSTTCPPKAPVHQFDNLVTLYIALFRNLLVPSTPLELHLLIRLLAVEGHGNKSSNNNSNNEPVSSFQIILPDAGRCQRFAVLALSGLKPILRNLPISLLHSLVQCEPFQKHCVDLAQDLYRVLESHQGQGLLIHYPTETVTGTHAIFSLPFDHQRDSRHNYKTQAETDVYKNRETIRDAFLGSLRNFINSRGSLHEKAQEHVRMASTDIFNRLLSVNATWFAQFYCELLLQVGLSPVQETDQELLTIADTDKLQKLHQRFSSRTAQTSKSSKKISLAKNPSKHSATPLDEARILFPGYQEFFLLFLQDIPYNFGLHLRAYMAKALLERISNLTPNDLEKKIVKLQILARFLGYLVFSPNWQGAGIDVNKIQPISSTNGLLQLESIGLFIISHVHEGWKGGRMIAVIPWVTELLRMAKWDSLTQASIPFRQLLTDLRGIQVNLTSLSTEESEGRFGPSMELVAFYLERFFDDTIGLPRLTGLARSNLGPFDKDSSDLLDKQCTGFSTVLLYASSPHMEDLVSLVDQISRGIMSRTPTKARKVRPSIVTSSIGIEPNKLFGGDNEKSLNPSLTRSGSVHSELRNAETDEKKSIEMKLAEAFFHQHRDIKEICEYAVDRVLKHELNHIAIACTKQTFEDDDITSESTDEILTNAEVVAFTRAQTMLKDRLDNAVRRSLEVFGFETCHPRVLEVATTLSSTRGIHSAKSMLRNLVSNSCDSLQRQKHKGDDTNKGIDTSHASNTSLAVAAIENLVARFDRSGFNPNDKDFLTLIYQATDRMKNLGAEYDTALPTESNLRMLMTSLSQLDRFSDTLLIWCQSLVANEYYLGLSALFGLQLAIRNVSSYGLHQLKKKMMNGSFILRFLEASNDASQGKDEVVQFMNKLLEESILGIETFTDAARSQEASEFAREVLGRLLLQIKG